MMIETALEAVEETRRWMKTAWGTDAPLEPIVTAIKSLEQQPCEDAVSRKAVLDIFNEWFATCNIADKRESPKAKINALPSVTPERPKGKWIFHKPFDDGHKNCNECIECNQCHTWLGYDCYAKTPYCPNCGAKMEVENADSD